MQHFSLLTAGWSYIPAGLTFGYLLMLPIPVHETFVRIYAETMYWPFLVAIITLLISVALTNGLKLNYRKCQFVHLYVMLAAMVFYLGAGLVFLLVKDVIPAIYLAACGLGLTLIPGLSYSHIRAPGRWRSTYMGCCYFWFLAGIAATATLFLNDYFIWFPGETTVDETVHTNFSICMLVGASFVILLVGVNEMLQREGIVDYKKPLDFDTDIAHESGKLIGGRGERRNLFNNFATTGPTTLGNGAVPKQWNSSTEQIIMGGVGGSKNYHKLWIFYMIFTKLQGFIAFYWIFVQLSVGYMVLLFGVNYGYSVFWFMTAGSLFGILAMLVLSPKIVFVISSVLHTIGLILAVSFYSTGAGNINMGVSLIIFYTFIGSSLVIPAINILELSSLNFNESFLAIGSIFELLAIALMQYFTVTDPALIGNEDNHEDVIAAHFIGMIVLGVILQVIVLWHMPNTYKKSLAEINSDLSRMTSYFAFSRMMVPVTHHAGTTRTFVESVTSDQPEIEEKQLSTRNGHLATRYNDQSDESTDRRSPYNDFSETRYNRRTMVERDLSPVPDQEDPYLQEQLQRQHERNYILSRQQHYQHQARGSPDSQQYNYQPERQSDLRQSRYIPELEDSPQDRPRSNDSQQTRYNPPLLSRHQYYEEYNQGSRQIHQQLQQQLQQKQPPVPLPKPVPSRQPSSSPSDLQSQLSSVLRRSANPSATVKSEPGYVSRPRLQALQSDAPAPPPLPPADYLTKSLPRIKPDRQQSRDSIHPVLIPKPSKLEDDIVPGVEYSHNLRPSEFLRQTRQSALYRVSAQPST
ncbi:uncharacterized protein LOC135707155 [Ochlerotatus camptorhynchus]|uniref:uncharacterized protein LOC135707155 n=1 Tax=Ochlerotatus camptorhynchus TaxID=644619 RepID=UPI0031DC7745